MVLPHLLVDDISTFFPLFEWLILLNVDNLLHEDRDLERAKESFITRLAEKQPRLTTSA